MIDFIDDMFSADSKQKLSEDLIELYNERAAIFEFDANMKRADAERLAKQQVYHSAKSSGVVKRGE